VFEFEGIPFKKADEIGQKMGIARDDAQRVQAAIYASLMNLTFAGGHTFVAYTQLVMQVGQLLQVSEATVISGLDVLLENGRLIQENQRLYPANLYHDEVAVAQDIKRLRDSSLTPFDTDFVETVLAQQKLTLDDAQIHAVTAALHQPLFVLTGGPGTGKTTIITTIVNAWQKWMAKKFGQTDRLSEVARQHRVLLASPTGRAAKRMTEVTGHPATTIHRLLGMVDLQQPEFDRETPLSGGLLIVDEASMLDIELTAKLLAAVPNGMRVVFVGDAQQLPSVGPGNVLADLLQSGEIPHANLQRVYRQDKQSTINLLAQHLQAGSLPEDFTTKQADRNAFMVTVQQIPDTIKKIVQAAANKGYTAQDVQILTPMYKTPAGVEALNPLLQDIFNPVSPRQKTLTYGQTTYRVGDKVLQLANDSERDIYNGDMGSITAVQSKDDPLNEDNEERLVVAFDQQTVYYPKKELHQLTLAYATTVHKAQGSEFPVVVVILTNQMTPMLNRNLLYTAITRAKQSLILVGDYRAFDRAAQQAVPPRQTALVQRLQGQIANADDQPAITQQVEAETISPIVPQRALTAHADLAEIDPMIGMGQLTPYDFMSTQ
jgi:exodeoxyribonuclease V alpha subunit